MSKPLLFAVLAILIAAPASVEADIVGVGSGRAFRIDEHTGETTPLGFTGATSPLLSLARNGAGTYYATAGDSEVGSGLYTLDPNTGAAAFAAPLNYQGGVVLIGGLAFSAGGTLYGIGSAAADGGSHLFTIDPETGAATLVGDIGADAIRDIAFAPDGTLFGYDTPTESRLGRGLLVIDPLSAALTDINPTQDAASRYEFEALTFSADGTLYAAAGGGFFSIATADGEPTFIANIGFGVEGMAFTGAAAAPVPEPAGIALLGVGLAGGMSIAVGKRRKVDR